MPEPYSISLLNDSFPPLIDGVANTVVNYARELTKLGDRARIVDITGQWLWSRSTFCSFSCRRVSGEKG